MVMELGRFSITPTRCGTVVKSTGIPWMVKRRGNGGYWWKEQVGEMMSVRVTKSALLSIAIIHSQTHSMLL